MTFWRRAPREVYRVYGQDEYLDHSDISSEGRSGLESSDEYESPENEAVGSPSSPRFYPGRLLGFGLLGGVTVCALGLVLLNSSHRLPVARRLKAPQSARRVSPSDGSNGVQITGHAIRISSASVSDGRAPMRRLIHVDSHVAVKTQMTSVSSIAAWWSAQPPHTPSVSPESETSSTTEDEFGFER